MNRRSTRYVVVNRDRLARVIRLGLRPYGGNQSQAAKDVMRSQRLLRERGNDRELRRAVAAFQRKLSRLLAKRVGAVTQGTLDDLRTMLYSRPGLYEEVRFSLISREGRTALWRHHEWSNRWLRRIPEKGLSSEEWARHGERTPSRSWLASARSSGSLPAPEEEGRRLVDAFRRGFPDVCRQFDAWCKKHGHSETRVHVAYARAVEPLLAGYETAGIERDWRELGDRDLKRYLDLGLRRERLLLKRAPDLQRAAAGHQPGSEARRPSGGTRAAVSLPARGPVVARRRTQGS